MSKDYDTSNPFTDPAIVRVQAQQTAKTADQKPSFGYNETSAVTTDSPSYSQMYTAPVKDKYILPPESTQPSHSPQAKMVSAGPRTNNFPSMPPVLAWCPIKPCFYFNITEEIPAELQGLVKRQYYFTLGYGVLIFLNFIGSIAYLILAYPSKVSQFLIALLVGPLFAFIIFLLQYFLLYKACRLSSANCYFWYLVNTIGCTITVVIQAIGPLGSGWNGLVVAAHGFDNILNKTSIFMGLFSLVISLGFLSYLANMLLTAYHARLLYMIAKHRELSSAISASQGGGGAITYSIPVSLA